LLGIFLMTASDDAFACGYRTITARRNGRMRFDRTAAPVIRFDEQGPACLLASDGDLARGHWVAGIIALERATEL
jgi:hypothetical protein